jgi:hypothetical protein
VYSIKDVLKISLKKGGETYLNYKIQIDGFLPPSLSGEGGRGMR